MTKHKECKHYSNGHCNLKNRDVEGSGPACGAFESK